MYYSNPLMEGLGEEHRIHILRNINTCAITKRTLFSLNRIVLVTILTIYELFFFFFLCRIVEQKQIKLESHVHSQQNRLVGVC